MGRNRFVTDRQLKADLDTGGTMIAHLLLEAVALAKLNGSEKGVLLYLWRRTYGWVDRQTGQKHKRAEISLAQFADALGTTRSYASRVVNGLVRHNVILRHNYEPGKVPTYEMNTWVSSWDPSCIDVKQLERNLDQGLYTHAGVIQSDNSCTDAEQLHGSTVQGLSDCVTPLLSDCATVDKAQEQAECGVEGSGNKELKERATATAAKSLCARAYEDPDPVFAMLEARAECIIGHRLGIRDYPWLTKALARASPEQISEAFEVGQKRATEINSLNYFSAILDDIIERDKARKEAEDAVTGQGPGTNRWANSPPTAGAETTAGGHQKRRYLTGLIGRGTEHEVPEPDEGCEAANGH